MNLLIDMGNTRIKWAITTAGQLMIGRTLTNEQVNRDTLISLWKGVRPRRVAISCVGAGQLLDLVQSVARNLWLDIDIVIVKSQAQAFGVTNAYSEPDRLGVDRWLSLVGVWQKYRGAACIADCGTAITLDLIDRNGRHQGGMICPGLTLMKQSLARGTAALPTASDSGGVLHAIAASNFTEGAILNGTLAAAVGLIEHVMSMQTGDIRLIVTGGDAELIAGHLSVPATREPDLVLTGLLCVLEGHP